MRSPIQGIANELVQESPGRLGAQIPGPHTRGSDVIGLSTNRTGSSTVLTQNLSPRTEKAGVLKSFNITWYLILASFARSSRQGCRRHGVWPTTWRHGGLRGEDGSPLAWGCEPGGSVTPPAAGGTGREVGEWVRRSVRRLVVAGREPWVGGSISGPERHVLEGPTGENQQGSVILRSAVVQGSGSWWMGSPRKTRSNPRPKAVRADRGLWAGVWREDPEGHFALPPTPSPTSRKVPPPYLPRGVPQRSRRPGAAARPRGHCVQMREASSDQNRARAHGHMGMWLWKKYL